MKTVEDQRNALLLALMSCSAGEHWIAENFKDGTPCDPVGNSTFIAGINLPFELGQIAYLLPKSLWSPAFATFAEVLENAPFDPTPEQSDGMYERLLQFAKV